MFYHLLYNNQITAYTLISQSAMGYCAGKPMEKSELENFLNSSRVLPTSHVVYHLITHRNVWSIAYVTFNVWFQKISIFKRKYDTKMEFLEAFFEKGINIFWNNTICTSIYSVHTYIHNLTNKAHCS